MSENIRGTIDDTIIKYKEELADLFNGNKEMSFDEITSKAIEEFKYKLGKVAEETTELENKKKQTKTMLPKMRETNKS